MEVGIGVGLNRYGGRKNFHISEHVGCGSKYGLEFEKWPKVIIKVVI